MKRYLKLYKALLVINFSKLAAYRGNFVNSSIVSLGWGIFSIASIVLLTNNTNQIFGWKRSELLILTGVYSIVAGMFHVLFSRNFERMAQTIFLGKLDPVLIKPVDSQFLLSFTNINYSSVPRVVAGGLFVWYLLYQNNISVFPVQTLYFILLAVMGLILLYSIWFTVMTITVKYPHLSNLTDLMFHVMDTAKYPLEMYRELQLYVMIFLVPLALVVSLPTKVLFQKASGGEIASLIALTVGFFVASRMLWKFALRFYTSASS